MNKDKFLFISHAEKDQELVFAFVELLYQIGLKEKDMFCSSISEIGVPIKEDIYDYLREQLDSNLIIPVFMLSENYYHSAACLNEMGAVWIKRRDYYTFLLPGFEFKQIKGAVNPNKKAIQLGQDIRQLKGELTNFKNAICQEFGLSIQENRWERYRDDFLERIQRSFPGIIIDMSDCEGYCINGINYGACQVSADKELRKADAKIDFSKTESELCSMVFYVGGIDMSCHYFSNKSLQFLIRADDIKDVSVEMHLVARNPHKEIPLNNEWKEYKIPLKSFCDKEEQWKSLNEICFVVNRRQMTRGRIELKDIMIT